MTEILNFESENTLQKKPTRKSKKRYALNKNKYLLEPEFDRLQKIVLDYLDQDPRNTLLIALGMHTGGRAQEILNLEWADLNDHDESLLIRGLKGSNDRELPLPGWLFKKLRSFEGMSASRPHPSGAAHSKDLTNRVFPISYNRLRQIWEFYRPTHKSFHSLRHTFAIRLYKKTKDIRLVQYALGHRNITNTMIYADYAYSQTELRKLIL